MRVGELRNDSQGNFLASLKPFEEGAWVPWLHEYGGPHPRVGQDDRSPIPTDVCEGDDLFEVFFGTVINGCNEIENLCEELWRKPIGRSALVQKVCCAPCRGFQHLVQFLDLCMAKKLENGLGKRAGTSSRQQHLPDHSLDWVTEISGQLVIHSAVG